jgi:hypothetical protein
MQRFDEWLRGKDRDLRQWWRRKLAERDARMGITDGEED